MLAILTTLVGGCAASRPDLMAFDQEIEVERFMGDWYVLAFIPIDLFFFSEADAHDAVENYRLNENGGIDVTYTFLDGGFDGETVVMRQRGRVFDEARGTEWRIQIFWPFESAYLIAWLDDGYERAIVGVPSRSNVWLLSRSPNVTEAEFVELTDRVAELGYDSSLLQRVPHRATRNAHH
jgi:apolipoprotein D and lipocalin family protein